MKQLIYTCPYSVMLMMKLHNIDFEARRVDQTEWFEIESKEEITTYAISDDDFEYRVAPDDVDKYQPRSGDIDHYYGYMDTYEIVSHILEKTEIKIVLRDGKTWINPCEVREVDGERA